MIRVPEDEVSKGPAEAFDRVAKSGEPIVVQRDGVDLVVIAPAKRASDDDPNRKDADERPIWDIIAEIGAAVPPEEWAKVPRDLSINLDHYLYGSPKVSE
jgi:hypothetical protein